MPLLELVSLQMLLERWQLDKETEDEQVADGSIRLGAVMSDIQDEIRETVMGFDL